MFRRPLHYQAGTLGAMQVLAKHTCNTYRWVYRHTCIRAWASYNKCVHASITIMATTTACGPGGQGEYRSGLVLGGKAKIRVLVSRYL